MKEEDLFKKSRMIVAGGLSVALVTAGIAAAGMTGADLNDPSVIAKVTPSKLSKKKFTKINVLLGVKNSPDSAGNPIANAKSERIAWSKNIKINLKKAPKCTAALPNGSTPQFAKDACPRKSYLGGGDATVHGPPSACGAGATEPCVIAEPTVSVFNGPGNGQLRLHTYSEDLGTASPIVNASIVKANQQEKNQGYGQALSVPNAPVTGALKITSFDAKITKKSGVASAKCKPKKFKWLRKVTYTDNSSETATKSQKCKVKR
jgi:hypothetical protein